MVTGWRSVRFPPAVGKLVASSAEVHVWLLRLDLPRGLLARLRDSLSAEERGRADRFAFPRDGARYTAAHGLVRHLLAGYLGVPAGEVAFGYGRRGKPHLGPGAGQRLRFNLSHAGGLALCAATLDREVGVDLERVRGDRDHAGIAGRFFTPGERQALQALPAAHHRQAFYDCWTRKEAYVKARGDGLAMRPDSFEVSLAPDAPATLLWSAAGVSEPRRWRLLGFAPCPGFAAALAVEGHRWAMTPLSLAVSDLAPSTTACGGASP
jgi:4'-phosphopantetheinyl transferase